MSATAQTSASPPNQIPPALTPTIFVGRQVEIAEIGNRLSDPTCLLLTLIGPGGIGKTALASHVAALAASSTDTEEGAHFPHGVVLAPLQAIDAIDLIAPTLADALGFALAGAGEPLEQICHFLHDNSRFV